MASPVDNGYIGLIEIVQSPTAGIPAPGDVRYARPPYSKQDTEGGLVTVIVRVRHSMILLGGSVLVTITVFVTVGAGLALSAAGLAGEEPHAVRMTPVVSTASAATVRLMVSVLAVTSSASHCLSWVHRFWISP